MCVLCGTPDPSHDLLLMRAAVVTVGAGGILAPRGWFRALPARGLALLTRWCARR